jgi:c-di-GMP-binding flagellar brake protein YcgR
MKKSEEQRADKRHPFHWPVAIVFDSTEDQDIYHGITYDVSVNGCAILTEHNIFSDQPVSVLLSPPNEQPGRGRTIIEIKARMVYTVLSAGHRKFRCGIQFLKFKGKGRATLKHKIEARAISGLTK